MSQLLPFLSEHWPLATAFAGLLVFIIIWELLLRQKGPKRLSPQQAAQFINQNQPVIIDIRDIEAFKKGHLLGALQYPQSQIETQLPAAHKNKPLLLVCESGMTSPAVAARLRKQGFMDIAVLSGGIAAWTAEQFPLTKK